MKEWHKGFEPVIDKNSRVLILGSFPSVKSREQGFYYGNPQNRFWKVLGKALNKSVPNDVDGRKQFLLDNGVALWDVIDSSSLDGSLDSNITEKNSIPVDFERVLKGYPKIELIILNGKKAYSVFCKFNKNCKFKTKYLPSTSPANTRFYELEWLLALKFLTE